MKGGILCFPAMCRGHAKNAVAADAIIVRKHSRGDIPSTALKEIELGRFGIDRHPCDTGAEDFSFGSGIGEAENKGGREVEVRLGAIKSQEIPDHESDPHMPDVVSDLSVNHDYASHTEAVDSDSARNSFTDLERGHVSDPGVYGTKEVESTCASPVVPHGGLQTEENENIEKQFLKQVSLGAPSESDSVIHPDNRSAVSGHPEVIPLSDECSSAGGERTELPRGSCVPTGGSPRSEGADQSNTTHAMFKLGASSLAMESQRRKPWWKVFLASNRNAHLEVNGGILGAFSEGDVERMSHVNGYMSDVDSRSGRVSPSLPGGLSDSEKEQSNSRRSMDQRSQLYEKGKEKVIDDLGTAELVKAEPKGEIIAFPLHQDDFSRGKLRAFSIAQNWDSFNNKTGLSRVEEWVSSTVHTMAAIDDDHTQIEVEKSPESPTVPAASLFGPSGSELEDRQQVAAVDAEMTKMVARLVNPLSTAADFSGVGLKVMPSLGMFGSLKTLNLSANSFLRILPGSLPRSLHSLDISRSNILVIEGLRELTRLRVLNLSFNRISRIGNGLSSCTSLKEVYLAGNKISEVEGIHRLSKLVVLDLSFNKLTTTKSMGQIAANHNSLKAFNLLGNAVLSNLGDEQMRRFVTGICPQLVYLNKQALKTVSHREALGKELKGSGKHGAKPSKRVSGHRLVSPHRRTKSGEAVGNVKNKSGGKEVLTPAVLVAHGEGRSRKGYHQNRSLPKGFVPLPLTAYSNYAAQRVRLSGQIETDGSASATSDGVLLREDTHLSTISGGIVQAH